MANKKRRTASELYIRHDTSLRSRDRKTANDRYATMVKRMQTALELGNAFFVVEALQLVVEEGILRSFEKSGYQLSLVY